MMLSFINTKGGTGKSTLACHAAIWLHDRGHPVALLDADEQQTASRWVQAAEPAIPVVPASSADAIRKARSEFLASGRIIVADTPGSNSEGAQAVTMLSDLAIVPLQPSRPDVRAITEALKFVRIAQEARGLPEVTLVLTFTVKGDIQARKLRRQISDLGLAIAQAEIRRLHAFRDACDSAVTRQNTPAAKEATSDIEQLFQELFRDQPFMRRENGKVAGNG